MDLLTVVSLSASIATVGSFFAASSICLRIAQKGSSKSFSVIPFFAGFFSTFLWLSYTFLANDFVGILVNSIGFTCFTLYIIFFYFYTPEKRQINKQICTLFVVMFSAICLCKSSSDCHYYIGLLAVLVGICCSFATLPAVVETLQTKCTQMLPFSIICSSVIVSSLWLLYGYLVNDPFIKFMNIFGVTVNGLQLSLFAIYPTKIDKKLD